MSITEMTLTALADAIHQRELSPKDVVSVCLDKIRQQNDAIGAFITVCGDAAYNAETIECAGKHLPLLGIPLAVKDNLCVEGVRTTCASRMLADYVAPYSATAWQRLADAGCVLVGKTNMDEFAMGIDSTTGCFGPVRNPHDTTRVAGGSSGGSAAAVAAGAVPLALGSDTGGSIRQPASFCGVVGMKPTYGRVSRYGLVAFASSLDTVGPITRTVADNALALSYIAGQDHMDATSVDAPRDFLSGLDKGVQGLRVGVPKQMLHGLEPDVQSAVQRAAALLAENGAQVTEGDLPHLADALPAYYIISSAEASSNLARYDGVRYGRRAEGCADLEEMYLRSRTEGFGDEVKRRILLGTYVLSAGYRDAYYMKALQVRTLVIRDFARAFEQADCLLGPVSPTTAWRIGEKASPLERCQADIHTVPASIAGLPALSVPFGCDGAGLPIGVQLMGPAFSEGLLYRVGQALERGRR